MNTDDEYTRAQQIHDDTLAAAMADLDTVATADDLVAVVRSLVGELREIPPRIRAMESCMTIADDLARTLVAAGVRFANTANAPAQLAGSLYACWLEHEHAPAPDNVEWLNLAAVLPGAVAWAIENAEQSTPHARATVALLTAEPEPHRTDWRTLAVDLATAVAAAGTTAPDVLELVDHINEAAA